MTVAGRPRRGCQASGMPPRSVPINKLSLVFLYQPMPAVQEAPLRGRGLVEGSEFDAFARSPFLRLFGASGSSADATSRPQGSTFRRCPLRGVSAGGGGGSPRRGFGAPRGAPPPSLDNSYTPHAADTPLDPFEGLAFTCLHR